jgi:hypothetical protein
VGMLGGPCSLWPEWAGRPRRPGRTALWPRELCAGGRCRRASGGATPGDGSDLVEGCAGVLRRGCGDQRFPSAADGTTARRGGSGRVDGRHSVMAAPWHRRKEAARVAGLDSGLGSDQWRRRLGCGPKTTWRGSASRQRRSARRGLRLPEKGEAGGSFGKRTRSGRPTRFKPARSRRDAQCRPARQ